MSVRVTAQMTVEQRRMVFRLRGKGLKVVEVARAADVHFMTVYRVLAGQYKRDEGRPDTWSPRPGRLTGRGGETPRAQSAPAAPRSMHCRHSPKRST